MPASSVHSNAAERKNVTLAKKRGVAIAALDERSTRPVKRRASKACQCCRSRKVRCNVVEHGAPCTNCRLDQVECVITESKRKRKSISHSDTDHLNSGADTSFGASTTQEASWTPPLSGPSEDPSPGEHIPHPLYRSHETTSPAIDQYPRRSMSSMDNESVAPEWNVSSAYTVIPRCTVTPCIPPPPPMALLPDFIQAVPPRLDSEEIKFLQQKGALSIPDFDLCNALMNSYAEFVDPSLPVLEVDKFIDIVRQADGTSGKVSLLVFQAVMFAGSSFVDISHLRRAGFSSRHQARRAFFARARLLYDHDYETDRIAVVQTLLLFTYWYETPDDPKDSWHWMGVATSVAQSIGMNRDPRRSNLDERMQRLWKRIWWSCVIRDRLIGIGMRRPIRIKDEEHDVPMVTLDDFSSEARADTQQHLWCSSSDISSSSDKQQTLALIFIEQAKLSRCIGNVINTQYTSPSSSLGQDGLATVSKLLPRQRIPNGGPDTRQCNTELAAWLADLPSCVRIPSDASGCPLPATDPAPVVLNRCLLSMVYCMTLSALHRPHAVRSGSLAAKKDADTGHPCTPEGHLRFAAFRITDLLQHLHHNKLARFLPTTGITVLQPAIINHLLDVKSEHAEVRMEGIRGFCQCFQVLSRLKDVYPGAEYSILIVDAAVKRAGLDEAEWWGVGSSAKQEAAGQTHELSLKPSETYTSNSNTKIETAERLVRAGLRLRAVTPPHDNSSLYHHNPNHQSQHFNRHWQFPTLNTMNQSNILTPPADEISSSSFLPQHTAATTQRTILTPPTSAPASASASSEPEEAGSERNHRHHHHSSSSSSTATIADGSLNPFSTSLPFFSAEGRGGGQIPSSGEDGGKEEEGESGEFLEADEDDEAEDEEGLDGYRRVLRDRELERDFDRLIDMDLDVDVEGDVNCGASGAGTIIGGDGGGDDGGVEAKEAVVVAEMLNGDGCDSGSLSSSSALCSEQQWEEV